MSAFAGQGTLDPTRATTTQVPMHDKLMMTLRCESEPTLADLVRAFGLPRVAFDRGFGVVRLHPDGHLYLVLVGYEYAVLLASDRGTPQGASGPRIEAFSSTASALTLHT
jgi:hypothetical protein